MKWPGHRQSGNVEDRRGGGGLPGGIGIGGGVGIGTVAIAVIAGWLFGINPLTLLGILGGEGAPVVQQQTPAERPPATDPQAAFVATVLADTEDVWNALLKGGYREPKLALFSGAIVTACGHGQAAMGPFYCPSDEKVYIDLRFFDTLRQRLGAPGDFAQAYVIAHEVAHHVQHQLGVMDKFEQARRRSSTAQANALSVRLELHADCLAGVWTHHSQKGKGWLEQGDIEEALNAASQIGDDTLQRRGRGTIVPESFTHGTSAQRVGAFKRGLQGGQPADCEA